MRGHFQRLDRDETSSILGNPDRELSGQEEQGAPVEMPSSIITKVSENMMVRIWGVPNAIPIFQSVFCGLFGSAAYIRLLVSFLVPPFLSFLVPFCVLFGFFFAFFLVPPFFGFFFAFFLRSFCYSTFSGAYIR